jgi:hypothetical protein
MSTGQKRNQQTQRRQSEGPAVHVVENSGMPRQIVEQHPMSTALMAFGIGIGVGVVLGSMLTTPDEPPTFGQRAEHAAEKLGRQVIDAITGVLPQSIARHVA